MCSNSLRNAANSSSAYSIISDSQIPPIFCSCVWSATSPWTSPQPSVETDALSSRPAATSASSGRPSGPSAHGGCTPWFERPWTPGKGLPRSSRQRSALQDLPLIFLNLYYEVISFSLILRDTCFYIPPPLPAVACMAKAMSRSTRRTCICYGGHEI